MPVTGLLLAVALAATPPPPAAGRVPGDVLVGLSAEFGDRTSTVDAAVELGMQIAIDEVNRRGGVLGGRRLALVERDNRAVAARMVADVRELAAMKDLVALFCGKFSPPVIEAAPVARELRLPILDPWAAADPIIDGDPPPGWMFRLSLRDSWAMAAIADHLARTGVREIGLLVPASGWGRSSERALRAALERRKGMRLVAVQQYDFGATALGAQVEALLVAGARAIALVANEPEGAVLVRELAALPRERRVPVASHWGITGGDFPALAGPALREVDLAVVQTYDLAADDRPAARRLRAEVERRALAPARRIPSAAGIAHAYDLTLVLARAIDLAGSTDRRAIRDALERVTGVNGVLRHYDRPFAPGRHEALSRADVFMARYARDGGLERIPR
jgi:branched-chain amino acid transport system substrate-binding protein